MLPLGDRYSAVILRPYAREHEQHRAFHAWVLDVEPGPSNTPPSFMQVTHPTPWAPARTPVWRIDEPQAEQPVGIEHKQGVAQPSRTKAALDRGAL